MKCCNLFIGMLNAVMLSLVRLNVVMLSVVLLIVVMPSVVRLSVIMLSVVLLIVVMSSVVRLNVVMPSVMAPVKFLKTSGLKKKILAISTEIIWFCFKRMAHLEAVQELNNLLTFCPQSADSITFQAMEQHISNCY
jgi:hypothetical protein